MTKIKIKLHPGSSQEKMQKISDFEYEIWINEKPLDSKANKYLEKFLKKYFKPCKSVKIVSGLKSMIKIVEVN